MYAVPIKAQDLAPNYVLTYSGGSGRVEIPSSERIQPSDELTIEAWIRPETNRTTHVFYKGDGGDYFTQRTFEMVYTEDSSWWSKNGGLMASVYTGTNGWTVVTSAGPLDKTRWHHVALVFSSTKGSVILYVDGNLKSSSVTDTLGRALRGQHLRVTSLPLILGHVNFLSGEEGGGIDEFRVWSISRTVTEIRSAMHSRMIGNEVGLVGYWNFDSKVLMDLTGSGNNGLLVGTPAPQFTPVGLSEEFMNHPPAVAVASGIVINGFVIDTQVTNGGWGYTNVPSVRFLGGGGSGASAVATVHDGVVSSITITNPGSGYSSVPVVAIEPPVVPEPILAASLAQQLLFTGLDPKNAYDLQVLSGKAFRSVVNKVSSFTGSYSQTVNDREVYRLAALPLPITAKIGLQVVNGFVVGANIMNSGNGYTGQPVLRVVDSTGSGAVLSVTTASGSIGTVTVLNTGSRYSANATVSVPDPSVVALESASVPLLKVVAARLLPGFSYQLQSGAGLLDMAANGVPFVASNSVQTFYYPWQSVSGFGRFIYER